MQTANRASRGDPKRRERLAAAAGAFGYLALDVLVRAADLPRDRSIPWYPASGVGIATLTIAGPRWAALIALARFLGGMLPRRFTAPLWVVAIEACVVSAAYATAAWLARRHVALDGRGWGVRDAAWLGGSALGATLVSALVAGTQIVMWRGFPWSTFAGHVTAWWASDAIGALVMLPFVLFVLAPLARGGEREERRGPAPLRGSPDESPSGPTGRRGAAVPIRVKGVLDVAGQGLAVALACAMVYALRGRPVYSGLAEYVTILPLTWAALRGGVTRATQVMVAYAIAATLLVTVVGAPRADISSLQFLLLSLATIGLFLGAARTSADEREARYWHVLAAVHDGVWRADREWRTVYVNDRLAAMLGWRAEELVGRHARELLQPWSFRRALARVRAMSGELAGTFEVTLRRRDGSPLQAQVRGSTVRSATTGATLGAVALVNDLTALRASESARRRSEQLVTVAFRTSLDAMALVRAVDGTVIDANDRWCELTGRTRQELLAPPPVRAGEPHAWGGLDGTARLTALMHEHGAVRDAEIPVRPHGGTELRHVLLSASMATADGDAYYLVTARDVTAVRRAEDRRVQLQRLEELGRLAGGIAHDFNNLLAAIGSFAELVEQDVRQGTPVAPEDVHEIRRGVDRGRDLTRRLLAFSRQQVVEPKVVDVAAALRDAEALLRSAMGSGVTLEMHIDDDLPDILADPGQLDQVLLNLATNARDAMSRTGQFTLRARRLRVAPGDAAATLGPDGLPGDYLLLSASDTGTGMDEATQARIFEPFFTTKPSGQGTGLGLAVVFGIVRQARGALRVESAEGRGTTFRIFWPAAGERRTPAHVPAAAPTAETDGDALLVLLVDDDAAVRGAARRMLERAGMQVEEAGDGEEALARLSGLARTPDVVLSDVVMPLLDGPGLAARLVADWPGLPVVLMTGYAGADGPQQLRDALPNVHGPVLEKPFDGATLVALVRRAAGVAAGDQRR